MGNNVIKATKATSKLTQEQLIENVATKLSSESAALNERKSCALSVFRQAANELNDINEKSKQVVSNLNTLMGILEREKSEQLQSIGENETVRQKILDIIGG